MLAFSVFASNLDIMLISLQAWPNSSAVCYVFCMFLFLFFRKGDSWPLQWTLHAEHFSFSGTCQGPEAEMVGMLSESCCIWQRAFLLALIQDQKNADRSWLSLWSFVECLQQLLDSWGWCSWGWIYSSVYSSVLHAYENMVAVPGKFSRCVLCGSFSALVSVVKQLILPVL